MELAPNAVLPVNEIRDYHLINVQVAQWLDMGIRRVRLTGVEGHRLLLSGLSGVWEAVLEVEGPAGPELAAELDAPNLVIVCYGGVADGCGRSLRAGSLVVLGDAGAAFGYRQSGGVTLVAGAAGARAGLELSDGVMVLAGPAGRLAGERQSGGRIYAVGMLGPDAGLGRRGGRLLASTACPETDDLTVFRAVISNLRPWLPPCLGAASWPSPPLNASR